MIMPRAQRPGPRRRCDHDARAPRLTLLVGALAPDAPLMCHDFIKAAGALFDRSGVFPELTGANLAPEYARTRQRRSERRQGWCLTLRALGVDFDTRTHRFGRPRYDVGDTAECPTLTELRKRTGITIARVRRALKDLEIAGYIVSHRVVLWHEGKYRGFASVRWATPLLIQRLGFERAKAQEQVAFARKRYNAIRARPASGPGMQRKQALLSKMCHKRPRFVGVDYPAPQPAPPAARPSRDFEANQADRLERFRLRHEHPDWGPQRVADEARRNLKRP